MKQIQENLTGNPYAGHAEQHITWTHDWQGDMGDTTETQLANTGIAQAYATLTLAYETKKLREAQDTANMIAFLHHADGDTTASYMEVWDATVQRLGLKPPAIAEYPSAMELADQIEAASKAKAATK